MTDEMITPTTWRELQQNGLLLFVNSFLMIFGYSIVLDVDPTTGMILRAYPARTKFRGFGDKKVAEAYEKISEFMAEHSKTLLSESKE